MSDSPVSDSTPATAACIRCGGTDDLMDRGMAPGMTYCALCRQYEVAKRRNANLPDNLSLAPKTPEGRKASGHAELP